ncbi:ABC transporter substrate-binding protein [Ancylobacter mangrovi]|uniref:ABC transporter substrate-binding protein n=1 Tax=Ancylobacter mangrovi TaxID=2972472 RepID=A0A9X2T295_9HYPH|nr:ABC transporter substrate-binding protein [Ancylobacter mangrovi]MCS0495637.1 ABC transporter substrate-binding protein [Ancylobacter mangrovi]MCS0502925.1 ABC transporter substrate-binding protein [Ancylobacter mangrovi]
MTTTRALSAGALLLLGAMFAPAQAQDTSRDIKIVLPSAVDVVEPCHMNSTGYIGLVLKENVVETLLKLDPKTSKPLPNLATEWNQVNPTTWRIKLREGVKFHDGTPFDADAVVTALKRQFVPELACRDKIRSFGSITIQPKAIDKDTVEIVTSEPMPLLPLSLAQTGMTAPSTSMKEAERHPIGTGPYVFTSWDPAQSLVLTRFDGYWGKKPEVAKATYVWRSEPALRASMVAVGEADIALQLAVQDATNKDTDIGYLNADTSRVRIFMDKPPLNDKRVREAMNLAIDRSAFIGTIVSPLSVPASQYMLPSVNGYNPDLKPWPYDPEKAKQLIEEARKDGVPVDTEIELYGSEFMQANLSEMLETLVQYWQEVGLNVKINMVDKIQHSAMRRKPYPADRPPSMVHELHDNTAGDAFYTMIVYYTSDGGLSNISNPELDKLLKEASLATGEKRTKLFQEANRMIQQDIIPDVMLYHMVSYIRVGKRVHYEPNFTTQGQLELSAITFK